MKIAICSNRAKYQGGGVDRVNTELAKSFITQGHKVVFIYKDGAKSEIRHVQSYKIKCPKLPFVRGIYYCLKLPKSIDLIRPDLVITQLSSAPLFGKLKQKHVHMIYNLELLEILNADINLGLLFERPIIIWCELFNCLKSDVVFGINKSLVKQISNMYHIKAKLIQLGVNLHTYISKVKTNNIVPRVVCVVRGDKRRKNIELLLRAVRNLPIQLRITNTKAQNLPNNVVGLGYVTEDKLVKELQRADVFVLPSKQEGFGLATLEALACNTPVVITHTGIWKEIVGAGAGVVVQPTIRDIKKGIHKSLSTHYGDRPRRFAEQYNWDITAKTIIKEACHKHTLD